MKLVFCLIFLINVAVCIEDRIKEDVENLVRGNSQQLTASEYILILENLIKKAPCNILVFGVGKDSKLWVENNPLGKTVFLEDDPSWLNLICSEIPQINAHLVHYDTRRKMWKMLLKNRNKKELLLSLPEELVETKWDIIFVDGPAGWSDDTQGRMKSIYTAAYLAHKSKNCHVFVHDCDRRVEAVYSSEFLMDKNLKCTLKRLRHYFIPDNGCSLPF